MKKMFLSDVLCVIHAHPIGGLYKAVEEAVKLNAKSFAMFLKSQRQWNSKSLEDSVADKFKLSCQVIEY